MIKDINLCQEAIEDVINSHHLSSAPLLLIVEISYMNMLHGGCVIKQLNESLNVHGYYFHPKIRGSFATDEWAVVDIDNLKLFHSYGA